MKLIIAGSRYFKDSYGLVLHAFYQTNLKNAHIDEIVSGTAEGIDSSGEQFAKTFAIPVKHFKPDWNKHGKGAGPIRNKSMAEYADALFLIWDGKSRGSLSMKNEMVKLNKPIFEVVING